MMQTAKVINVTLQSIDVRHLNELEPAIERARSQLDSIVVVEDGLFVANRARIAELAIKNRLPSIGFREYCEAGGLAAYGVDFPQIWRGAGAFVDKILKGRKPADLPIEQATRFEIILNLKTANNTWFQRAAGNVSTRQRGDRMKVIQCLLLAQSGHRRVLN
jgi:putative tryptophan/tyrosine transport system substrate-binding protein